jgi:hypothetical protein
MRREGRRSFDQNRTKTSAMALSSVVDYTTTTTALYITIERFPVVTVTPALWVFATSPPFKLWIVTGSQGYIAE